MGMKVEIGMRFGHLTVISQKESGQKRTSWLCECDCGNKIVRGTSRLIGTETRRPDKSCGCKQFRKEGVTLDNTNKRIYNIWREMIRRCYNKNADNYERYGGNGITVSDKWREDVYSFIDWSLANGYQESLTIDRKDPTKPYGPSNCRWVSYTIQNRYKGTSKNNKLGHKGVVAYNDRYRAYISWGGKRKHLGVFKTLEEAVEARKEAEKKFNQE